MPNIKLDEFDLKIIDRLQAEGRLTNVELAEQIGLSPSPCLRRVRLLEAAGIIKGYAAQIDRAKVGLALTVFVEVKMAGHSARHMEGFNKWVQQTPEVISCQLVSGDADYLLEIVVSDLEEYTQSVVLKLRKIEGLQSMQSHFVLESVKRSGASHWSCEPGTVTDPGLLSRVRKKGTHDAQFSRRIGARVDSRVSDRGPTR